MAHNLSFNEKTGLHSFFSVKEKPWHGLGQIISDYPTSSQAIKYAGLDYEVEKRPLFTVSSSDFATFNDPNADDYFDEINPNILIPNRWTTVRTDTDETLGIVGNDYNVVQNIDAFAFLDSIVGNGDGLMYETAGALGIGERIFITVKLPQFIRVGNDLIENYLFVTSSHDGLNSITVAFTPIRIVCNNTLNAALGQAVSAIKIKHTSNAIAKLDQATQLLGITNSLSNQLNQIFNKWSRIRINDNDVKRLVQLAMAPNKETIHNLKVGQEDNNSTTFKNRVNSVLDYAFSHPTQQDDTTKGTLWGAFNAVTGFCQNVKKFSSQENKLNSIMTGKSFEISQSAYKLCSNFAYDGATALQLN